MSIYANAIVITLKQINSDGTPTGLTKLNDPEDPDYIAPFPSAMCPIPEGTSTTSSTTLPPPPLQYLLVNDTIYKLSYIVVDIDDNILKQGSIYPGQNYTTQFFDNVTSQSLRVNLPIGLYDLHKGVVFSIFEVDTFGEFVEVGNALNVNSDIITDGDNTVILGDKITLDWGADPDSLSCETTDDSTTTTTTDTTTTSTTTTTTLPFISLRYTLHALSDSNVVEGTILIMGTVGGLVKPIHSSSADTPVDTIVNSISSNPLITNFWLTYDIVNPNATAYLMIISVDGATVVSVPLAPSGSITGRAPVSGSIVGRKIDVFFVIDDVPTIEWEADPSSISCELEWDGSGTTSTSSTTTMPTEVSIALFSSNLDSSGPYATPPTTNASVYVTLSDSAPADITIIFKQGYMSGSTIQYMEVNVLVVAGTSSGVTHFDIGSYGSPPSYYANPLYGVPCILGYMCASPVTFNYSGIGCKVTSYNSELISNSKNTSVSINSYSASDVLVDTVNFLTGLNSVEQIIVVTGYQIVNVVNAEATSIVADIYLDNVFFDYFTILAGATQSIRVPSSSTHSPQNIKIVLT